MTNPRRANSDSTRARKEDRIQTMSVATASQYAPVTAAVVSGGNWLPTALSAIATHVAGAQEPMLRINVPGFDLFFGAALSDMHASDDYSVVTVEALLDASLIMLVTLKTQVADDAGNLRINEVAINFDVTEHRPRAHFLAASLYAMLPLAGPIRVEIPTMKVDVRLNFSAPLREISTLLQKRQAYYGLMVIERATDLRLDIPEDLSGEEMNDISFTYHAIVERTFYWLAKFITLPMPANEESLTWLNNLQPTELGRSIYKLQFGPAPEFRTILGQTVNLGLQTVFIEDAVMQNREEVRRELSALDGHMVPIMIRPLSGMGRYHLPDAPQLPDAPWDEQIETCIRLEDELNERLAARYSELAAATLDGLTPAEIKIVTERPTLSEGAHLIKD